MAQRRAGPGATEAQGLRAQCLSELVALDKAYANKGRFLSLPEEQVAKAHCTAALQALARLAQLHPEGPWKLTPKAHALWHIAHHSAMGNPRVAHCYQDEDFMHRVKGVYTACHGKTAPLRTIQRYCMGAAVSLTAQEQLLEGRRAPKAPRLCGGPQRGAPAAAGGKSTSGSSTDSASGSPVASEHASGSRARGRGKRGRGRPPVLTVKRKWGRPSKAK